MRTTAAAASAAITSALHLVPPPPEREQPNQKSPEKNEVEHEQKSNKKKSNPNDDGNPNPVTNKVKQTASPHTQSNHTSTAKTTKSSAMTIPSNSKTNVKNQNSSQLQSQQHQHSQTTTTMGGSTSGPAAAAAVAASMGQFCNSAMFGQKSAELSERNRRLAEDLAEFVERVVQKGMNASHSGEAGAPCDEKEAELQLQTARMIRQILPGNRELLPIVQEKGWTQLLFGWLNLHDRPAVQVEALLALTSIADLSQQSPASVTDTVPSVAPLPGPASAGMNLDGSMTLSQLIQQRGGAGGGANVNVGGIGVNVGGVMPNAAAGTTTSPQYNPYAYPYMPWNYDPSNPSSMSNMTPHMLNDPAIQAAINSGQIQHSIIPNVNAASSSTSTTSLPPQPSSFTNSSVPHPTPLMGNFSQPMSQNLLLNNAEALPTLISLLSSPNREVHEHAMWILGNIAAAPSGSGTSAINSMTDPNDKTAKTSAKEILLNAGVMPPLLSCLEKNHQNTSLQRIGSWAISNFVEQQGKSGKSSNYGGNIEFDITLLIPTLKRLLGSTDHEILNYTCWALSHLCDSTASLIAAVVTTTNSKDPPCGLVPRLVELLHHENWKVTKPALRTIGNIVCAEYDEDSGDKSSTPTDFTEVILECDAVPRLKRLIAHSNREIQKEACWTLSNIAAGTVDQIQAVIDSGAIPPLVQLVNDKKTDQEVRSEACWVVLNATSCGSDQQISVLVSEGCVSVLGLLLEETTMVSMALEGLERVLQVEKNYEITRKEKVSGLKNPPQCPLVDPYLVKNAMKKPNSNKVTKKVQQIWNDHFVSCALCNIPYSKHRSSDAKFCEECKCHVCSHCNCTVYHLSYQEELWAASEEKVVASKQAKKSKKQKKKEKRREKNKTKVQVNNKPSSDSEKTKGKKDQISDEDEDAGDNAIDVENSNMIDQNLNDTDKSQPPIDFSLYLQQTGSIIALARLMDDFYEGNGYNCVKIPNQ